MRRVLTAPSFLIAANAGYNGNDVVARLAELGPDDGFDALEGRYGNMIEMGIIDPLRVARSALQNAGEPADHHVCRCRHGRPSHGDEHVPAHRDDRALRPFARHLR